MTNTDFTFDGDFWQSERHMPFLDRRIEITLIPESEGEKPSDRQIAVVDALQKLRPTLMDSIDEAAYAYFKEFADLIDEDEDDDDDLCDITRENIRSMYEIHGITVPRLGGCQDHYQFFSASCEWEIEHGMEVLLKNGNVVSCGPADCLYLNEEWDDYIQT
jgi:hypothetical protein